jgi:hypothetical protein
MAIVRMARGRRRNFIIRATSPLNSERKNRSRSCGTKDLRGRIEQKEAKVAKGDAERES